MLIESDINFRTLVFELNEGIYICDLESTFIYANLALAKIFGVERPANIIGRKFTEFLSPDQGKGFNNRFLKLMINDKQSELISAKILRPDGTTAHIEIKPMAYIRNERLAGGQGVLRDVTDFRRVENKSDFLCTHDQLTGLYSRSFFEAELARLEKGRQFPISILVVSIDHLNENSDDEDTQSDNNKIMRHIAHMLYYSFRGDEILARILKDDFAILLPNTTENVLNLIIARIRENLEKKTIDQAENSFRFYIGACTGKKAGELNSILQKAKDIILLEKKKESNLIDSKQESS